MRRRRGLLLVALLSVVGVTSCSTGTPYAQPSQATEDTQAPQDTADATDSPDTSASPEPTDAEVLVPQLLTPPDASTVLGQADAAGLALATSQALFESAPVVVVADATDPGAQARAAAAGVALGMPLLLTDGTIGSSPAQPAPSVVALTQEVERLGAEVVLAFGPVAGEVDLGVRVVEAPDDDPALATLLDVPAADDPEVPATDPLAAVAELTPGALASVVPAAVPDPGSLPSSAVPGRELPATDAAAPLADVVVLSTGEPHQLAAVATATAAQVPVLVVPGGDPRATSGSVQALAAPGVARTVGLGGAFGDAQTLGWRVAAASTGTELPGGGQLVLPGKTYVALYGTPITESLGVLGEQAPEATIERAQQTAVPYQALTDTTVVPALEIIATVAAGAAGADGNYSNERPIEELRPLVDLARQNGQYVVLDLQPGRSDFLSQAMQYEELLREPHVGLALDPEWRLGPDEVHLRRIGQVDVEEVNAVVTWLADLTRANRLPQKLLVLHQFQVRMIPGVDGVDQSRSELAVLVHVDGQGSQPAKQDTWRVLRTNAPSIQWWGWKNFYDEDSPMLTPEQTMQVEPPPQFISYQ